MEKFQKFRIVASVCFYLLILSIGFVSAATGPALSHLGRLTESTLDDISFVFTGRSIGYFVGSIVSGPLFDVISKEGLFMGITIIVSGVCNIAMPYCTNLILLVILHGLQGISIGALDAGGSVCLIRIHGKSVDPWMQGFHFFYALGTTVSPSFVGININAKDSITIVYIIFGAFMTLTGIPMLFMPPFKKRDEATVELESGEKKEGEEAEKDGKGEEFPDNKLIPKRWYWITVASVAIILFVYATIEIIYAAYIATYGVMTGLEDVVSASYLTSILYGLFCAGRLVAIPVSLFLTPVQLATICVYGCLAVMIPLFIWTNRTLLWVMTGAYGFFMGPIWASLFNMMSKNLELTGTASTVVVVGSSLGDVIFTVTVGNLMNDHGPDVLTGQQLISALLQALIYIPVMYFIHKVGKYTHPKK